MGWLGKYICLIAAAALMLGGAACGSGSESKHSGKVSSTPATVSHRAAGASITSGPVHASFTAPNHTPKVGKPWPYSVRVSDASGHPLSGTVKIQFTFGGQVVGTDTPPVHPVTNGSWHDNLTFPKAAVGEPITLQAVVHTSAGSVTLNWPVTAQK